MDALVQCGELFRSHLVTSDVTQMALARSLFLLTAIVPPSLYYFSKFGVDSAPKFPATISYTIRAGVPKWLHHVIWTSAWLFMYSVLHRCGDIRLRAFALQMFCTGVFTTGMCSLGKSELHDAFHAIGAGFYMLDHSILFYVLDVEFSYIFVFYSAFIAMISAMAIARLKYHWKEDSGQTCATGLWWLELVIMVSEFSLFLAFVASMCSGMQNVGRVFVINQPSMMQEEPSSYSLAHHLLDFGGPAIVLGFFAVQCVQNFPGDLLGDKPES